MYLSMPQPEARNNHDHVPVGDNLSATPMFYYDLSTRHTIDREVWHQEPQHAAGEDDEDQQGSGRWCASISSTRFVLLIDFFCYLMSSL